MLSKPDRPWFIEFLSEYLGSENEEDERRGKENDENFVKRRRSAKRKASKSSGKHLSNHRQRTSSGEDFELPNFCVRVVYVFLKCNNFCLICLNSALPSNLWPILVVYLNDKSKHYLEPNSVTPGGCWTCHWQSINVRWICTIWFQ